MLEDSITNLDQEIKDYHHLCNHKIIQMEEDQDLMVDMEDTEERVVQDQEIQKAVHHITLYLH